MAGQLKREAISKPLHAAPQHRLYMQVSKDSHSDWVLLSCWWASCHSYGSCVQACTPLLQAVAVT